MRLVLLIAAALSWATVAFAAEDLKYGPEPAWVKPLEAPAPDEATAGAIQPLLYDAQVQADEQGLHTYAHAVSKAWSSSALGTLGNVQLTWRPEIETITVHHLLIRRGDEVIDVLKGGQAFTILRREQNLDYSMLDGELTASLQVAGLQVGDTIDLALTTSHLDPVLKGHLETATGNLVSEAVRRMHVRLMWPKDSAIRWRVAEGLSTPKVSTSREGTELVVDMLDVQAVEGPQAAPARYFDLGYIEFSDFSSWRDISALMAPHYAAATTLAPDSPLKAEVAKIRARSNDPKVQAAIALRLVQDQVRYAYEGMNNGNYVRPPRTKRGGAGSATARASPRCWSRSCVNSVLRPRPPSSASIITMASTNTSRWSRPSIT